MAPELRTERLRNAPAEHADALLSGYELLQLLHDRGVLNLVGGLVSDGDEWIGAITSAVDTPASIPPDALTRLVDTVSAGAKREKAHKATGFPAPIVAAPQ